MDIRSPLIAHRQSLKLRQLGHRAFDHLAMPPQPAVRFNTLASDSDPDAPPVQRLATAWDIIRLVRVDLGGPPPVFGGSPNGRDRVQQLF